MRKNLNKRKKNFAIRPLTIFGFLTLAIIVGGFSFYFRWVRAASFSLYPGSCLGSWQNPHLAQGQPDISNILQATSSAGQVINKDNAAVFSEGGVKEIYCGSFNGDLSENEIKLIKNVNLKFSWLVADEEPQAPSTSSGQVATSSITIIQPPATSSEAVAQNTNDVIDQILNNIHADEVQVIVSTTTSEIMIITTTSDNGQRTNDLENTAAIGNSAEIIDEQLEIPVPEIATSSSTSFWWGKYSFFSADDQIPNLETEFPLGNSVSTVAATSSLESPLAPTEDFLKVFYTLDGVDWQELGTVNKNNWQDLSFNIPVYHLETEFPSGNSVSTLEDVKKIQLKIESLPILNKTPFVYLDGVWLEVNYNSEDSAASIFSSLTSIRRDNRISSKPPIYSRSQTGNNIVSPVSFSVSFENFSDLGCDTLINWNHWGILVETSDLSKDYFSDILAPATAKSFVFSVNLPADDYVYVVPTCHLENNWKSFGIGEFLESAFEDKVIFSTK